MVFAFVKDRLDKEQPDNDLHPTDVHVVWFSKTLQNWKALVSTTLLDGLYYEVTYNGDMNSVYIDVYKKLENHVFNVVDHIAQM
jgi:hypothetical protein